MKNNNTKHNIMKNLTLTILSFFLIHSYSYAAIVYTDISPDKVLNNNYLEIDLDNDGTNDISIDNWSDYTNGTAYAEIMIAHGDISITAQPLPHVMLLNVLDLNKEINPLLTYGNKSTSTTSTVIASKGGGNVNYTPWIGQSNKYVGFRIKNANNQHYYGWIELSFSANYILTVHGYAIEDVANTSIKAGDIGGSTNNAPTNIALSNNAIDENQPTGSTIGTFSTADADAGDAHTYSLVAGNGDGDNSSFTIDNNILKSNDIFNFETNSSYSIRVKTDDGNSGTFEKQFTININNINDVPNGLFLVNLQGEMDNMIDEGDPVGSVVAYIGVSDDDTDDNHTFSFVGGDGSDDNDQFTIDAFALKSNAVFDYETKSSYTIRVKADDGNGGTYEQILTVAINDINNANLENIVKKDILVFPNPASSILHIQGIQPNSKIQLISPTGVVVYEQKNNSSNVIVNMLELSTGVYWLNVSDHNNTMVTRMITIE